MIETDFSAEVEAVPHFLGKGKGHQGVTYVDDEHGCDKDGDSGACGVEVSAGE